MNVAVVITAHNRPEYFDTVLKSWAKANRHHNLPFYFAAEPVSDTVVQMCRDFAWTKEVQVNPHVHGPLMNPHTALTLAFDHGYDFVILGEDDSIVSEDAIDYFTWCAEHFEYRPVLGVCSFQDLPPSDEPDSVHLRQYFASVVWGTWRDRWDSSISEQWPMNYDPAWDGWLVNRSYTMPFVFPAVSRSQHIGQHGGAHMHPDSFADLQARAFHEGSRVIQFKEVAYV